MRTSILIASRKPIWIKKQWKVQHDEYIIEYHDGLGILKIILLRTKKGGNSDDVGLRKPPSLRRIFVLPKMATYPLS